MIKYAFNIILVILMSLAAPSLSHAAMLAEGSLPQSSSEQTTEQTKIFQTAAVVKNIKGNILYLNNNTKYDLDNVKVTYLKRRTSSKFRIAQMTFLNNVLQEVVIR